MADESKDKKIIIDEDWKNKAQKEKEELHHQEEAAPQAEENGLPPADLSGLINMLATQALFALGLIRGQEDKDKEIQPDLVMARFHIDMLAMIETKCKGNMTDEEEQFLSGTLSQLRMAFVHMSR